jgi:hypothetical protein
MIRPAREEPVRLSAPPKSASRAIREAAETIAGPSLRAVLRGEQTLARAIVANYDDETIDALAAAADRLGVLCREIRAHGRDR